MFNFFISFVILLKIILGEVSIVGHKLVLSKPYLLYLAESSKEIWFTSKYNVFLYFLISPFTTTKSPSLKAES